MRTGFLRDDVGGKTDLDAGQELRLVLDYSFKGDNTYLAVSYNKLCTEVKEGSASLCADGSLSLKVKSVGDDRVITEVMNSCRLGEQKN